MLIIGYLRVALHSLRVAWPLRQILNRAIQGLLQRAEALRAVLLQEVIEPALGLLVAHVLLLAQIRLERLLGLGCGHRLGELVVGQEEGGVCRICVGVAWDRLRGDGAYLAKPPLVLRLHAGLLRSLLHSCGERRESLVSFPIRSIERRDVPGSLAFKRVGCECLHQGEGAVHYL